MRTKVKQSRYVLTVNALSADAIDRVKQEVLENSQTEQRLVLDHCFGPCSYDGSYLAIFSSDTQGDEGFVPALNMRSWCSFFCKLCKNIPHVRFTLKEQSTDPDEDEIRRVWGKTRGDAASAL